ncbi:hypothetical protein [Flavihumibacter solisilvae]|uniref:hypothetical protein n=1 Tax=Flavihumibacter solisilvae TaxID=1349421 RepID=UPI00068E6503|nr:hypothetical protein [Flavihumibacter solisilvae]
MQPGQDLIQILNEQLEIELPEIQDFGRLREGLASHINNWIQTDFDKLVQMLYRVDINENKLKFLLREKVSDDAALIIADLVIERQLQKLESRKMFRQPPPDDEEERW